VPTRDYYSVLGIPRSSSEVGIREAFRELALRFHPDRAGKESTAAFQDILEAYRVLVDPEKRGWYDTGLAHAALRPPRPVAVTPLTDERRPTAEPLIPARVSLMRDFEAREPAVEEVLQRLLRNFSARLEKKSDQVEALELDIVIGPDQAAQGGSVTLDIPVFLPCLRCRASGHDRAGVCRACQGRGLVEEERPVRLLIPPMTHDGEFFEVPLRGLGIHNLYLRVNVRVDAWR